MRERDDYHSVVTAERDDYQSEDTYSSKDPERSLRQPRRPSIPDPAAPGRRPAETPSSLFCKHVGRLASGLLSAGPAGPPARNGRKPYGSGAMGGFPSRLGVDVESVPPVLYVGAPDSTTLGLLPSTDANLPAILIAIEISQDERARSEVRSHRANENRANPNTGCCHEKNAYPPAVRPSAGN